MVSVDGYVEALIGRDLPTIRHHAERCENAYDAYAGSNFLAWLILAKCYTGMDRVNKDKYLKFCALEKLIVASDKTPPRIMECSHCYFETCTRPRNALALCLQHYNSYRYAFKRGNDKGSLLLASYVDYQVDYYNALFLVAPGILGRIPDLVERVFVPPQPQVKDLYRLVSVPKLAQLLVESEGEVKG